MTDHHIEGKLDENSTEDEIKKAERLIQIENDDKKEDAQRRMAWFSLFGMLLYPLSVVIAEALKLSNAATILGSMAATYFVSVAAIVMAFFGAQAYSRKVDKDRDRGPRP